MAALVGRAALLLREFNEAAMAGSTLDPAALTEVFDGVIAVLERLPNTLRRLGGHLVCVRSRGAVADPLGRDAGELAERVRQRCHDTAEALPAMTAALRQARALTAGLTCAGLRRPALEGLGRADGWTGPGRRPGPRTPRARRPAPAGRAALRCPVVAGMVWAAGGSRAGFLGKPAEEVGGAGADRRILIVQQGQ
ncbi:hypothetical protein ACWEQL_22705 [Kitasatospora sp. NPDC004240]